MDNITAARRALSKLPPWVLGELGYHDFADELPEGEGYTDRFGYCIIGFCTFIISRSLRDGKRPETLPEWFIQQNSLTHADQSDFAALVELNDNGELATLEKMRELLNPVLAKMGVDAPWPI